MVKIKKISFSELLFKAWESYNHHTLSKNTHKQLSFNEFQQNPMKWRVCVNFVKHILSNYDQLIKNKSHTEYINIKTLVLIEIAKNYPILFNETKKQYEELRRDSQQAA